MLPCTSRGKDAQWSHYSVDWSVRSKPIEEDVLLYDVESAFAICCMSIVSHENELYVLLASAALHCCVC